MKNSILIALAVLSLTLASCIEPSRSHATFNLGTGFELSETDLEKVSTDSIMFSPQSTWDNIMFFKTLAADLNVDYLGGFVISLKKGSSDDPESLTMFSSADPGAGALNSNCYMAYYRTPTMPDYDIVLDLSNYSSATSGIIGFYVCNSLYNTLLAKEGMINPGDFLKLKMEFFNKSQSASVGMVEKYLVDYTNASSGLKMIDEWEAWDIAKELQNTSASVGNFDAIRFYLDASGSWLKPCFCIDSFYIQLSVEY